VNQPAKRLQYLANTIKRTSLSYPLIYAAYYLKISLFFHNTNTASLVLIALQTSAFTAAAIFLVPHAVTIYDTI